jgi:hypothetical protein
MKADKQREVNRQVTTRHAVFSDLYLTALAYVELGEEVTILGILIRFTA